MLDKLFTPNAPLSMFSIEFPNVNSVIWFPQKASSPIDIRLFGKVI